MAEVSQLVSGRARIQTLALESMLLTAMPPWSYHFCVTKVTPLNPLRTLIPHKRTKVTFMEVLLRYHVRLFIDVIWPLLLSVMYANSLHFTFAKTGSKIVCSSRVIRNVRDGKKFRLRFAYLKLVCFYCIMLWGSEGAIWHNRCESN